MYSVFLTFNLEAPDAEDEAVRRYLADHQLVAKQQSESVVESQRCEEIYFGGCYLGRHLEFISAIQRKAMEWQTLALEIPTMLREGGNLEARDRVESMSDDRLTAVVNELVEEYWQRSSFASDEDGRLHVSLDPIVVQGSFLRLDAGGPRQPTR